MPLSTVSPFAGRDLNIQMLTLQVFNGAVALGGLLLTVTIIQRDRAQREIADAAVQLGEVVTHLG
jgi:hypothetical protein